MIFITSSIIPFLTEAIDIPWLIKKLKRRSLEKKKDKCILT